MARQKIQMTELVLTKDNIDKTYDQDTLVKQGDSLEVVNLTATGTITYSTISTGYTNITSDGTLDVAGATTLQGALTVTGATTIYGATSVEDLEIRDTATINDTLEIGGATTILGAATVTGATILHSTVELTTNGNALILTDQYDSTRYYAYLTGGTLAFVAV